MRISRLRFTPIIMRASSETVSGSRVQLASRPMKTTLLFSATSLLFAPTLLTQDFIGLSYNGQISATSRGSVQGSAGEVMTRIDGDEIAGWGGTTAGVRTIDALYFILQDQNAVSTPESVDILVYPEDPANPGFPDLSGAIVFATGVPGPPAPATGLIGAVARLVTGPGVSVPIQGGGDVFISFRFAAAPNWPSDGVSVQVMLGYQPSSSFTVFDTPNGSQGGSPPPAPSSPADSHGLSRIAAGPAVYNARRQHLVDIAHPGAGGVGLAITNQTSLTGSNNPPPVGFGPAPGTANMLSGTNPDVSGFNAGRVDDITMEFYMTGAPPSLLVAFLLDFSPIFGPEVPLSFVSAGSTGSSCLLYPFVVAVLPVTVVGTDVEAFVTTPIPAPLRLLLLGASVKQQAIGLDLGSGTLHGSPCDGMGF